MSRQARVVAEAVPHHVTQRGNNRQDIFLTDDDRRYYLAILREKSLLFGLTVLGFCVMTNHVHVIGVPRHANSLAKALGQAHWRYAMYFNRRYRRSGHLWQNRFYSKVVQGDRSKVTGRKLSTGAAILRSGRINRLAAAQQQGITSNVVFPACLRWSQA